jgi:uncharacterized membrane-anchored protein
MLTLEEKKAYRGWFFKVIRRVMGAILLWLFIVTGFALALM